MEENATETLFPIHPSAEAVAVADGAASAQAAEVERLARVLEVPFSIPRNRFALFFDTWIVYVAWGLAVGVIGGATAGTSVVPLFGTLYGGFIGGVVGLGGGVVIGPFLYFAMVSATNSTEAIKRSRMAGAILSSVILVAGVTGFFLQPNYSWTVFAILFAIPPVAGGAAWAGGKTASWVLRDRDTERELPLGNSFTLFHVFLLSCTPGLCLWPSVILLNLTGS